MAWKGGGGMAWKEWGGPKNLHNQPTKMFIKFV